MSMEDECRQYGDVNKLGYLFGAFCVFGNFMRETCEVPILS